MSFLNRTLRDPFAQPEALIRARNGVIEAQDGQLLAIHLRALPKVVTAWEVIWLGERRHRTQPGDHCWLYYHQPRRFPNFLALKYMESQRDCTLATVYRALEALDEVARLKQTDALLCDAMNPRVSVRMAARCGWESHKPSRWHRHFIKRFYGDYPAPQAAAMVAAPLC